MNRLITTALAALATAGCAGSVPSKISHAPPNNLSLADVRTNLKQHLGSRVRWGGIIVGVQNKESETQIEVVAQNLGHDGRPKPYSNSAGRFQARVNTFLDPVIYEQGRQLTVVGIVNGEYAQHIGQYPYYYPVVDVIDHHLWKPIPPPRPYRHDPWMHDPWPPDRYSWPYYP